MIKEYIKKYSKASIVASVIMIVASVLLIVFPKTMLDIVVYVISGALFVDGLIHFVTYFTLTHEMRIFSNDLLEGILALLAGVLLHSMRMHSLVHLQWSLDYGLSSKVY